jgi:hypothetical protein
MEHGWENKEEEHKLQHGRENIEEEHKWNTAGKIKRRNTNGKRPGK